MKTQTLSQTRTWAGILLVLATGLIHGVEGPANYHEAAYKGLHFFLQPPPPRGSGQRAGCCPPSTYADLRDGWRGLLRR